MVVRLVVEIGWSSRKQRERENREGLKPPPPGSALHMTMSDLTSSRKSSLLSLPKLLGFQSFRASLHGCIFRIPRYLPLASLPPSDRSFCRRLRSCWPSRAPALLKLAWSSSPLSGRECLQGQVCVAYSLCPEHWCQAHGGAH